MNAPMRQPPKRTAGRTVTYLPPLVKAEMQKLAKKRGNVISLSQYLAELCERHVVEEKAIEIAKHTITGRLGNL